jgi:plastocyanin
MKRVYVLSALLLVLLGALGWASPQAEQPAVTFHVQLGMEHALQGVEINHFFPADLTVNAGDTIEFTQVTHEPHTVTFNAPSRVPEAIEARADHSLVENPQVVLPTPAPQGPPAAPGTPMHLSVGFDGTGYVNSGFLMTPGDTFSVTFLQPGTYPYVCLIHATMMKGTVTVNPAGSVRPMTDADYSRLAQQQIARLEQTAESDLAAVRVPQPVKNSDGTSTYTVLSGVSDEKAGIDFPLYFGGRRLVVKAGDTVHWTMSRNMPTMPHTVTFLSGGEEPPLVIPQTQGDGPPVLLVNPKLAAPSPAGHAVYDGTGYFNSGIMVAGTPTPQDWSVKFSRPGEYHYICVLHDEQGMQGDIVVLP